MIIGNNPDKCVSRGVKNEGPVFGLLSDSVNKARVILRVYCKHVPILNVIIHNYQGINHRNHRYKIANNTL